MKKLLALLLVILCLTGCAESDDSSSSKEKYEAIVSDLKGGTKTYELDDYSRDEGHVILYLKDGTKMYVGWNNVIIKTK